MQLQAIEFEQIEGESYPAKIAVEMTVEEALWVAQVFGQQRGTSPHSGIYSCLHGDVFNRYWEGGVDEAKRMIPITTPPIRYDEN